MKLIMLLKDGREVWEKLLNNKYLQQHMIWRLDFRVLIGPYDEIKSLKNLWKIIDFHSKG